LYIIHAISENIFFHI